MAKAERKWVIGQADRFGPCEELVTLVPSAWGGDDNWYFLWSANRAVPQSVVFDNAQDAALAAIAANNDKISGLNSQNKRLQEWYDGMVEGQAEEEARLATEGSKN